MTVVEILRWPENKRTGIVPWFVMARRLLFWPLLLLAGCLGWIAILGAYGYTDAKRWWRDAM